MDLITTIDSEEEISILYESDSDEDLLESKTKRRKLQDKVSFDGSDELFSNGFLEQVQTCVKEPEQIEPVLHKLDIESSSDDDQTSCDEMQKQETKASSCTFNNISFSDMNLSRPLLKSITWCNFDTPTPIQARTIPLALMGQDICACASTGTGKTGAFMLPILERLLHRPTLHRISRVLILVPTRELAIQVHSVGKALAQSTSIQLCLATGGLGSKEQEATLRLNPDVIIATPGRLLDHLHNTPSFSLQTIEILVLDEADRMLDEHFLDQMNEIIRLCPLNRQTLLYSATMTKEVKSLARLSLKDPKTVFINSENNVPDNLCQEFIRIRQSKERDREAIIIALCCRSFKENCLVFLPTKSMARRLRIIFGLLGLKATELHGSLNQEQRLESLKKFREGEVAFLLATDLAARGLDIKRVTSVVNYSMPPTLQQYIHRVGRTARAGRKGRSVTLVGEKDRKTMKECVKGATIPPKSRTVSYTIVQKIKDKVKDIEKDIKIIMEEEKQEKEIQIAQMKMKKVENLIKYEKEIQSRPPRTWFQKKKQ